MPEVTIPGVGVVHFPYDMSPEQIAAQARRLHKEASGPTRDEAPLTLERRPAGEKSATERMAFDTALSDDALPTDRAFIRRAPQVGAIVGGVMSGGLAAPVALAASGALARRQAEQGLHVPTADDAGDAITEGAIAGAFQLAPQVLLKGATALGHGLYGRALGPSKALRSEHPDVIETGIREGFNVTPKGAAAAEAAGKASAHAARDVVATSPAATMGVRLKTGDVLKGLDPLRTAARKGPQANKAIADIDEFARDVATSHPRGFGPVDLLDFKQVADKAGRAAHKAAQVGNLQAGPVAEMNKAVADRARAVLAQHIPSVKPINARTQSLMGVERGIDEALQQPQGASRFLGSLGVGALSNLPAAAATFAATSPRVLGRAGIMLGRTGQSPVLQRTAGPTTQATAQAFRAALLDALDDTETGR